MLRRRKNCNIRCFRPIFWKGFACQYELPNLMDTDCKCHRTDFNRRGINGIEDRMKMRWKAGSDDGKDSKLRL